MDFDSISDETLYLYGMVTPKQQIKANRYVAKQLNNWLSGLNRPVPDSKGVVHAEIAAEYILQCNKLIESKLIDWVNEYHSIQWLWYLRRLPDFVFQGKIISTAGYNLFLAETLSSKSSKTNYSSLNKEGLLFPINKTVIQHILRFCSGVKVLSQTHVDYRYAGKGVSFRFKSKGLLEAILSEKVLQAVALYDKRSASVRVSDVDDFSFTRIASFVKNNKLDIFFAKIIKSSGKFTFPFLSNSIDGGLSPTQIDYRYIPVPLSLEAINELVLINGIEVTPQISSILFVLFVAIHLMFTDKMINFSLAQTGYAPIKMDLLKEKLQSLIENRFVNLYLFSELPSNAAEIVNILKSIAGSTWPLCTGSIIREYKGIAVLDFYGATYCLEYLLESPKIDGKIANLRGAHFEHAVQTIIDQSVWKPSSQLAKLRGRKLRRINQNGEQIDITDIDSIGEYKGKLLMISCKAEIYSSEHDIGDYRTIRNSATRLEKNVQYWQSKKEELKTYPVGQNYDFSSYKDILAFVCTPQVVYTPLGEATELESSTNLFKAVATHELKAWLNNI